MSTRAQGKKAFSLNSINIVFWLAVVLYRVVLDCVYVEAIVPRYAYWAYLDKQTTTLFVVSWIIYVILVLPIKKAFFNEGRLSSEVLFVLFIFSIAPFTTLVRYGHFDEKFILYNTVFWVILLLSQALMARSKRTRIKFKLDLRFKINEKLIRVISIFLFIVNFAISGYYTGFRIAFGIGDALSMRLEEVTANLPSVVGYVYLWSQVIVPVFLAYFLKQKNWTFSLLCIATQVFSYGINGMKTTLFVTFVIVALFIVPKMTIKKINILVFIMIILACLLGIAEIKLLGTAFVSGVIVLRMMFMPNSINYYYYDFFSNNTPDYLRASFLRHFGFSSPYDNVPRIIGTRYFNSDMWCNDGLSGDAFANFGVIGIIVLPILIAYVLDLFDRNSEGLDSKVYLGSAIIIGIRLMSSYLSTNLLSYGFIILILLFRFLKRDSGTNLRSAPKYSISRKV